MARILTPEEEKYNTDSLLCDDMWEFHPDIFDILDHQEKEILFRYYPQDFTDIPDVFAYRMKVLSGDPELGDRARNLLAKVLATVGITLE